MYTHTHSHSQMNTRITVSLPRIHVLEIKTHTCANMKYIYTLYITVANRIWQLTVMPTIINSVKECVHKKILNSDICMYNKIYVPYLTPWAYKGPLTMHLNAQYKPCVLNKNCMWSLQCLVSLKSSIKYCVQ